MTYKEIAERLRKLSRAHWSQFKSLAGELADELDPPRPKPGTVVVDDNGYCVFYTNRGWIDSTGLTITDDHVLSVIENSKPARILAPDDPDEEALSDVLQERIDRALKYIWGDLNAVYHDRRWLESLLTGEAER